MKIRRIWKLAARWSRNRHARSLKITRSMSDQDIVNHIQDAIDSGEFVSGDVLRVMKNRLKMCL